MTHNHSPQGVLEGQLKTSDHDVVRRLDELRLDLITDLSHQLRTPVTAMKLALEGLFSQLQSGMSPPQQHLAEISRRNIDRIVTMVENQLELLQMTLGEVQVARRLVDIRALIDTTTGELFPDAREIAVSHSGGDGPFYVFTDPDRTRALLSCLLCGGPPGARRELDAHFDGDAGMCTITVRVHYLGCDDPSAAGPSRETHDGNVLSLVPQLTRLDFEQRAYSAMLTELGGEVTMGRDADLKHVAVRLPVYPEFDRRKDFVNPAAALRRAGQRANSSVVFLKCEFEHGAADGHPSEPMLVHALMSHCRAVLAGGERLVRGRQPGSFYVALLDRNQDEIDHIRDYLGRCGVGQGSGTRLHVSPPQTILTDATEVARLVETVETVDHN